CKPVFVYLFQFSLVSCLFVCLQYVYHLKSRIPIFFSTANFCCEFGLCVSKRNAKLQILFFLMLFFCHRLVLHIFEDPKQFPCAASFCLLVFVSLSALK